MSKKAFCRDFPALSSSVNEAVRAVSVIPRPNDSSSGGSISDPPPTGGDWGMTEHAPGVAAVEGWVWGYTDNVGTYHGFHTVIQSEIEDIVESFAEYPVGYTPIYPKRVFVLAPISYLDSGTLTDPVLIEESTMEEAWHYFKAQGDTLRAQLTAAASWMSEAMAVISAGGTVDNSAAREGIAAALAAVMAARDTLSGTIKPWREH